jgi:hypothetical protein
MGGYWVARENNTDFGSQILSKSPKEMKLLVMSDVLQFRKHCAETRSVFVCESTQFSVMQFSAKGSAVVLSNRQLATYHTS